MPPEQRPTAQQLAAQSAGGPVSIAGKPADTCPYCGCAMFVDGVNRTDREIVRYVACRNRRCGKRFMSKQPPAKLIREVGDDEGNSAGGNPALTLVRESA